MVSCSYYKRLMKNGSIEIPNDHRGRRLGSLGADSSCRRAKLQPVNWRKIPAEAVGFIQKSGPLESRSAHTLQNEGSLNLVAVGSPFSLYLRCPCCFSYSSCSLAFTCLAGMRHSFCIHFLLLFSRQYLQCAIHSQLPPFWLL